MMPAYKISVIVPIYEMLPRICEACGLHKCSQISGGMPCIGAVNIHRPGECYACACTRCGVRLFASGVRGIPCKPFSKNLTQDEGERFILPAVLGELERGVSVEINEFISLERAGREQDEKLDAEKQKP